MVKKKSGRGEKILITLILAGILIAVVSASLILVPQKQIAGECRKDSDCIKVQTTCCSCSMGGEEVCAAKSQENNLSAKNCPADLMCIAMYNCKIKSCVCMQGKCEGKE